MPAILYNHGSGPGFGTGHTRRAHWLRPAATVAGFDFKLISTPAEAAGSPEVGIVDTIANRDRSGNPNGIGRRDNLYIFDRLSEPPDLRPGHFTIALDNYCPWPGHRGPFHDWQATSEEELTQLFKTIQPAGLFLQCIPHPSWPQGWEKGGVYFKVTIYRGLNWLTLCSAHFFWGNPDTIAGQLSEGGDLLYYLGGLEPRRLLEVLERIDDRSIAAQINRRFLFSQRQKSAHESRIREILAHKWPSNSVHWVDEQSKTPLTDHLSGCAKMVSYYGLLCLEVYPRTLDIHLLPISQVHRHLGRWLADALDFGFGFHVGPVRSRKIGGKAPWTNGPESVVGILKTLAATGH